MTRKEAFKIAKANGITLDENASAPYFSEEQFNFKKDRKVVGKIFRSEAVKYFEKKGFVTYKDEWKLQLRPQKKGCLERIPNTITLDIGADRRLYHVASVVFREENANPFEEWLTNEKSLFKTMRRNKSQIYVGGVRKGGSKYVSFEKLFEDIVGMLKKNNRKAGEDSEKADERVLVPSPKEEESTCKEGLDITPPCISLDDGISNENRRLLQQELEELEYDEEEMER